MMPTFVLCSICPCTRRVKRRNKTPNSSLQTSGESWHGKFHVNVAGGKSVPSKPRQKPLLFHDQLPHLNKCDLPPACSVKLALHVIAAGDQFHLLVQCVRFVSSFDDICRKGSIPSLPNDRMWFSFAQREILFCCVQEKESFFLSSELWVCPWLTTAMKISVWWTTQLNWTCQWLLALSSLPNWTKNSGKFQIPVGVLCCLQRPLRCCWPKLAGNKCSNTATFLTSHVLTAESVVERVIGMLALFHLVTTHFSVNFDNMKALLDDFCKIAQKDTGEVDIDQFAAHLNVPVSESLKQVFELYDRVSSFVYLSRGVCDEWKLCEIHSESGEDFVSSSKENGWSWTSLVKFLCESWTSFLFRPAREQLTSVNMW